MAIFSVLYAQFLVAGILVALTYRIFKAVTDPLRSVPGPLLARFTRFWYLKALNRGDFEKQNIDLHRKHGTSDECHTN
jgi:hypothetical protein